MRRTLTVIAAALVLGATAPGAAQAAPAPVKELCKDGGFSDYIDPATGQPFTNQGQCVSVANGVTELVPVETDEPPVEYVPVITITEEPGREGTGTFGVLIKVTDLEPNAPLTWQWQYTSGLGGAIWSASATSDGTFDLATASPCVSVNPTYGTVNGVTIQSGGVSVTQGFPVASSCTE